MKGIFCFVLLAASTAACAGQSRVRSCPSELTPHSTVPPTMPAELHNEYSGEAQITFLVGLSGSVSHPAIVSLTLRPVGHSGSKPRGYREALLAAVRQWRYAPQPHTCRKQVTIAIEQAVAL